jgi:hypothetical protein
MLVLGMSSTAKAEYITYDKLSPEALSELERLETIYFDGVRSEALKLMTIHFDVHTIFATFTPQIRIIRQRKRQELRAVERYLYSCGLREEFVSGYIGRLREDVVDCALDALLEKAKTLRTRR